MTPDIGAIVSQEAAKAGLRLCNETVSHNQDAKMFLFRSLKEPRKAAAVSISGLELLQNTPNGLRSLAQARVQDALKLMDELKEPNA